VGLVIHLLLFDAILIEQRISPAPALPNRVMASAVFPAPSCHAGEPGAISPKRTPESFRCPVASTEDTFSRVKTLVSA